MNVLEVQWNRPVHVSVYVQNIRSSFCQNALPYHPDF